MMCVHKYAVAYVMATSLSVSCSRKDPEKWNGKDASRVEQRVNSLVSQGDLESLKRSHNLDTTKSVQEKDLEEVRLKNVGRFSPYVERLSGLHLLKELVGTCGDPTESDKEHALRVTAEGPVVRATCDRSQVWSVTFSSNVIGFTPGLCGITVSGEAFWIDPLTGAVWDRLDDLTGALEAYFEVHRLLSRGEISTARQIIDQGVEIVDSPETDDVGPLNVAAFRRIKNDQDIEVTVFGLYEKSGLLLGNGQESFIFERRAGKWFVIQGSRGR